MTPTEAALGYPRNSLATHTEALAVRNSDLQTGDVMTIMGSSAVLVLFVVSAPPPLLLPSAPPAVEPWPRGPIREELPLSLIPTLVEAVPLTATVALIHAFSPEST